MPLAALLLFGCAAQEAGRPPATASEAVMPRVLSDFSGHWEMDYGRSDNVQQKLDSVYRELQRAAERAARAQADSRSRGAALGNVAPPNSAVRSLVALARMADHVTASQVLEIEQTEQSIEVKREENFALTCALQTGPPKPQESALGSEICGWDAHQLVFIISLPDGLRINHRMTVAEDGESLQVATTVASADSRTPFTVNRVYYRFEPLPEDYACEYTLTRGRVCSRSD
jgi:hypothetical protein